MECYEGATMNKTFRGKVADTGIDTILLHSNNGSMGYRIKALKTIVDEPAAYDTEATLKIYSVNQTTTTSTIDFADNTLLAVSYAKTGSSSSEPTPPQIVLFDNIVFNQDIYITSVEPISSRPNNYYVELEPVKLDLNANTVATLKDMRNTATPLP